MKFLCICWKITNRFLLLYARETHFDTYIIIYSLTILHAKHKILLNECTFFPHVSLPPWQVNLHVLSYMFIAQFQQILLHQLLCIKTKIAGYHFISHRVGGLIYMSQKCIDTLGIKIFWIFCTNVILNFFSFWHIFSMKWVFQIFYHILVTWCIW